MGRGASAQPLLVLPFEADHAARRYGPLRPGHRHYMVLVELIPTVQDILHVSYAMVRIPPASGGAAPVLRVEGQQR